MSISTWSIEDYKKQWDLAWKHLETNETSIFVVSIAHKRNNFFIEAWALYKIKNTIYIYNEFINQERYPILMENNIYTPETSFNFIPPRDPYTSEGKKISEWQVNIISEKN
jgi:hypothetical protein